MGGISANTNRLEKEVVVPLKYFSNFWRSINVSLINCKTSLICHGQKIVQ